MATKVGKRYRSEKQMVPAEPVSISQAVRLVKQFNHTKFDQTVELTVQLGIDPKQADQNVRGSLSLPHGIGKLKRVIAFCEENKVQSALDAGAIEAGGDELVAKIQKGWTDFDVAIATPAMMRSVSRLGRILGPAGKMPSPKSGTVTENVADAVKEFAAGKVSFRNDDGGNVHVPVGKLSFDEDKLQENIEAFLAYLQSIKPAASKGAYIKKATLSATMSPSIQLNLR